VEISILALVLHLDEKFCPVLLFGENVYPVEFVFGILPVALAFEELNDVNRPSEQRSKEPLKDGVVSLVPE
jgi:hypothetical protein